MVEFKKPPNPFTRLRKGNISETKRERIKGLIISIACISFFPGMYLLGRTVKYLIETVGGWIILLGIMAMIIGLIYINFIYSIKRIVQFLFSDDSHINESTEDIDRDLF